MAKHAFYLAEAHIVGVTSASEYKIWLLDHYDETWIRDYKSGKHQIPMQECVDVNLNYTLDKPGPTGQIHFLKRHGTFDLTRLSPKVPIANAARGQVAIHESLWAHDQGVRRPLPPDDRGQDYRLKILTNHNGVAVEAFFGYYVEVAEVKNSSWQLRFFSWTGEELGIDWFDLSSPVFNTTDSMIKPSSGRGDKGSLFVSLDHIPNVPFLKLAKVPYNGGS